MSSTAIDRARYHGWERQLRSPWWATLAIVRVALLQIARRKLYWIVLALGLLNFLVAWIGIYIVTQLPSGAQEAILERFDFSVNPPPGRESGYVEFMARQSLAVMMLLALGGSLIVGSDFRMNSLPFYLSRRIDRRHYIAGKLSAVATLIALLTVVPALLLFLEYGFFTSSIDYWVDNWRIVVSILGYGGTLCVVLSIWLVTLSAYLQRMAPIAITWASLFVLLEALSRFLTDQWSDSWSLISPWRDVRLVGRLCFDAFDDTAARDLSWWALGILSGSCLVCLMALARRVRAVEIIS